MKVGFCEKDITPTIGMEQPGNYGKAYISKIRDPLKVRASVFDDGKKKIALVGIIRRYIGQPFCMILDMMAR